MCASDINSPTLPVFGIDRHRLATDGAGVTTLVGAYGCPLQCRYCLNPHAWNPETLKKCTFMTPEMLYEQVKIDELYFLATGGGVTFGGGESLLHADFIRAFRQVCGPDWKLTAETSLNVPQSSLQKVLGVLDAFIVDIKDLNPFIYQTYTGKTIDAVMENLHLLEKSCLQKQVLIRVPSIPGHNTEEDVSSSVTILKDMGFTQIDIFPYIIRKR